MNTLDSEPFPIFGKFGVINCTTEELLGLDGKRGPDTALISVKEEPHLGGDMYPEGTRDIYVRANHPDVKYGSMILVVSPDTGVVYDMEPGELEAHRRFLRNALASQA